MKTASLAALFGVALALVLLTEACQRQRLAAGCELREGAVIRGPLNKHQIAFVFTGHEYAEGCEAILDALSSHAGKGSFFFTGVFLTNREYAPLVQRIVRAGHYLGPHSDGHVLYCAWEGPKQTLLTQEQFQADLNANLRKIARFGRKGAEVHYFLPPFEHYNQQIADWTRQGGLILINLTPGTRSAADYTGEQDRNFVPSETILQTVLECERKQGLNGCILLLHVGSGPGRKDKFAPQFGRLLDLLQERGYRFVTVPDLLQAP
jgi:peptidoglycan/xylan/chitin deacetylase (PgdA/CDA1 family)